MAAELGRRLQVLNAHVTTAESCTGGGLWRLLRASRSCVGRGPWIRHLLNRQKTRQLNVPETLFPKEAPVSQEVVEAMVCCAQEKSLSRFAVAVSGVAGGA